MPENIYNIFITTFYDEEVEKIDKILNSMCKVLTYTRSKVVKEFFFWRVSCSEEIESKLSNELSSNDKIVWFKIERIIFK